MGFNESSPFETVLLTDSVDTAGASGRRTRSDQKPLIVGIGGTTRPASLSERALMVSLNAAEACGAQTLLIGGRGLNIPLYDPNVSDRTPEANALVAAFRKCDGLIIASPAYHGAISGMVKNALDYAEGLRTDPRVYFDGMAVGCIACGAGWQAASQTLTCLRTIVHSLRGWPTPLDAALNSAQPLFDGAGACIDAGAKSQLETIGRQVFQFPAVNTLGA